MPSDLILPAGVAPSNLHLSPSTRATFVEGDLYNIAERVREVSRSLYILQLENDERHAFAIMENCEDGVQRLVFKVAELDGRVIEKLRYLMARPLQERLAELERMEYKFEEERKEREQEELYERVGRPMWTELERCGFIQRGVSYAKRGVKPRRS